LPVHAIAKWKDILLLIIILALITGAGALI